VPRLATRSESSLSSSTLTLLEEVRSEGVLPAVYLQYAASERALQTYLGMEAALREGSLSSREIEAIKILVSAALGCEFCSTVHAAKGRRAGLTTAVQDAIRAGNASDDQRLDALLAIVRELLRQPGILPDELLADARGEGVTDQNLLDLTLAMATIFFTNITNHVNDTRLP